MEHQNLSKKQIFEFIILLTANLLFAGIFYMMGDFESGLIALSALIAFEELMYFIGYWEARKGDKDGKDKLGNENPV